MGLANDHIAGMFIALGFDHTDVEGGALSHHRKLIERLTDEFITMHQNERPGLPLDQGLAALARDMARGELQKVTASLAEDLRAGRTLPEALEARKSSPILSAWM